METWKDIPGYVGLYQASDDGRVRRLKELLNTYTERGERRPMHVLKASGPRAQVMLYSKGKGSLYLVGRLVLMAFDGVAPPGCEARHIDGNRSRNTLNNLKWSPRSRPVESDKPGLTAHDVVSIRASSLTQQGLAKMYGISQAAVSQIRCRKTWKHVP